MLLLLQRYLSICFNQRAHLKSHNSFKEKQKSETITLKRHSRAMMLLPVNLQFNPLARPMQRQRRRRRSRTINQQARRSSLPARVVFRKRSRERDKRFSSDWTLVSVANNSCRSDLQFNGSGVCELAGWFALQSIFNLEPSVHVQYASGFGSKANNNATCFAVAVAVAIAKLIRFADAANSLNCVCLYYLGTLSILFMTLWLGPRISMKFPLDLSCKWIGRANKLVEPDQIRAHN